MIEQDVTLVIDPDGTMRMIYDDAVRNDMRPIEQASCVDIKRAANVEPNGGYWEILDTEGKHLSHRWFETRESALRREREIVNARLEQ